jgi:excisionase family DNA binding protein
MEGGMDETYLTVPQVAKRLQVSRQAIYNWITEGKLKAVRIGTALRIPESALLEFIQPVKPGERLDDDSVGNHPLALAVA